MSDYAGSTSIIGGSLATSGHAVVASRTVCCSGHPIDMFGTVFDWRTVFHVPPKQF